MTKKFFEQIVSIPTYSGKEDAVVDFIRRWAKGNRCRFRQDGFGNVYLTKGSAQYYVCLSNHVDTVHKDQAEMVDKGVMKELEWKGDVVTAKNPITGKQTGLGGDDLCGCAIALAVLAGLPAGKAVFTVQEELGCVGAKAVDKSFFEDVSFVIGSDSPEFNRATRYSAGVLLCGEELFEKHVKPICMKHGVTNWKSEPLCDCQLYRKIDFGGKYVDCVNLGNGALNPHQDTEYAKFSDVCAAEDLVRDLCTSIPTDRQWTSGYKEEERPKWNPYSYGGQSSSRFDSYRDWISKYRQLEQREFDFKASPDDREFIWEFRNGEAAANLYVRRVGGLLAPEVKIEKEGEASVRVTGPERRLTAAFRFAYNYDNGTSFMDWEQFEKAVPRAKEEFERALAEREPAADDDLPPSPMERSDSELCSVDVTLSDPDSAPDFVKALSEKGIDADPDDDGYGTVNLYGTLGDLKRAYVEWWNLEENSSYGSWGEFAKAEPPYANAFFDDVEFQDKDSSDVIDAEFTEISENAGWLSRYRSGTPL